MKTLCLFICAVAAVTLVRADQVDNNGPNGPNKGNQGAAVQRPAQPAVVNPKVQPGNNGVYHANRLPGNPMMQGNPNVRFYGQPRGQYPPVHTQIQGQGQFQGQHHFQLSTVPNPKVASVKFQPGNHIAGSEKWQGQHYNAFRSYHSEWHDHDWWRHHHNRCILIGGGWYFWDAGFWYPAWGYDAAYSYYAYDGPIYAYNDLPPDQVIANVQAALQQQGYYTGDIDGTLGPLTRAALAGYQRDHGLYMTSAIDQPTLASLGME